MQELGRSGVLVEREQVDGQLGQLLEILLRGEQHRRAERLSRLGQQIRVAGPGALLHQAVSEPYQRLAALGGVLGEGVGGRSLGDDGLGQCLEIADLVVHRAGHLGVEMPDRAGRVRVVLEHERGLAGAVQRLEQQSGVGALLRQGDQRDHVPDQIHRTLVPVRSGAAQGHPPGRHGLGQQAGIAGQLQCFAQQDGEIVPGVVGESIIVRNQQDGMAKGLQCSFEVEYIAATLKFRVDFQCMVDQGFRVHRVPHRFGPIRHPVPYPSSIL